MPRGHLPPTRRLAAHCPRKVLPRAFATQRKGIHFPFLHAQHVPRAQLPNTSGIIEYYTNFCDAYRPCWTSDISGWFKVCYRALDGAGAASMTDPSMPPNIHSGILQPWCNAFTLVPAPLPVSEPRTDRRRDSHL